MNTAASPSLRRPIEIHPRTFTSLKAACAAIGNREHIDFLAVIGGKKDTEQTHRYKASEVKYTLLARGFDERRGDSVLVWLP